VFTTSRWRTEVEPTAVYAVQIDDDLWVVHAFEKKSKTGIKTPKQEIDVIRQRLRRVQEGLK
jgi:phage-related protein